ncbi:hypothetical protein V8F06_002066 [Rhypophila decipiens]
MSISQVHILLCGSLSVSWLLSNSVGKPATTCSSCTWPVTLRCVVVMVCGPVIFLMTVCSINICWLISIALRALFDLLALSFLSVKDW